MNLAVELFPCFLRANKMRLNSLKGLKETSK